MQRPGAPLLLLLLLTGSSSVYEPAQHGTSSSSRRSRGGASLFIQTVAGQGDAGGVVRGGGDPSATATAAIATAAEALPGTTARVPAETGQVFVKGSSLLASQLHCRQACTRNCHAALQNVGRLHRGGRQGRNVGRLLLW